MFASLLAALLIPGCTPATGDARAIIQRSAHAIGLDVVQSKVLMLRGSDVVSQDYQSDRTSYPPYLSDVQPLELWYSPVSGVERRSASSAMAGYQYGGPVRVGTERATYMVRDTALVPSEDSHAAMYASRPLNAWAVVRDWENDATARVVERCVYRDYPRLVLRRTGAYGAERLFVDEKSGFPVKLERDERHYLWGQNRVEYVYSTWQRIGDAAIPGVSFRMVDGQTNVERNLNAIRLVSSDSAPPLEVPPAASPMSFAPPAFLRPSNPDTIRLAPNVFVLRNPGYAEMVALARDTVFLFDATQGDERARLDSVWIGALFPGKHPIALVVTDVAWPHIAGVRYWASLGTPIYAHRAAVHMIDSVIARHWTITPDRLEQTKRRRAPRIHPVSDTLAVAGGELLLFAIDGASSEVALAGFDNATHVLWGSDYIQDATAPSMYLDEMCHALRRVHRTPTTAAAEHLRPTAWEKLRPLAKCL
ncbi:MAG TPA: hypothetical protein VJW73_14630 [Gemmatimonadaceae bacterium]|nr:hypothetical protein [Gemmatimonadaceae bacterium]